MAHHRRADSALWPPHEALVDHPDMHSSSSSQHDVGAKASSFECVAEEEGEGKKRRRTQQACKACSLRRVKCNGARPCQTCLKNRDECLYGQPKKRGPPKGTTRGARRDLSMTSAARAHSPSSATASTNLLALQNSQPYQAASFGAGKKSTPVEFGNGPPPLPIDTAASGRNWPYEGQDPSGSSVYLGSTSGWSTHDGGVHASPRPAFPGGRARSYIHGGNDRWDRSLHSHSPAQPPSFAHQHSSFAPAYSQAAGPAPTQGAAHASATDRHGKLVDQADEELEVAEASLATIFRAVAEERLNAHSGVEPHGQPASQGLVPFEITLERPFISDETRSELFHIYWANISLYWPLFFRKKFPNEEAARRTTEAEHPLLFNAICSISALNCTNAGIPIQRDSALTHRQMSTIFYARARYHTIRASQSPSLESAAALVLLSLRELGAGRSAEAGGYCWSACRMALDLGLHRHGELCQSTFSPFSQVEDESRRRVFWCAYVLDKTLAAQLGRPPVLRSAESDCPLPEADNEEDEWMTYGQVHSLNQASGAMKVLQSQRIGVMSYFINGCRLAAICESIIEKYNVVRSKQQAGSQEQSAHVSSLHHRLTHWMQASPEHLKWKPNQPAGYLPHILHQQVWSQVCMILIHRPYILKGCADPEINSHGECSRAMANVCGIFEDYERLFEFRSLPSSSVYCLFTAATIALANTTSTEAEVAALAKKQLLQCTRWLTALSKTWTSAFHHVTILQRLASGIDPGLAYEAVVAPALDAKLDGSPTPLFPASQQHMPLKMDTSTDSAWTSLEPDALGPGRMNMEQPPLLGREDFGIAQAQSVDAFWNDMPLGENFQRWDQFTQAYFKQPTNMSAGTDAPLAGSSGVEARAPAAAYPPTPLHPPMASKLPLLW